MSPRVHAVIAGLLVLPLVAGCSASVTPESAPTPSSAATDAFDPADADFEAVAALMKRRAKAINTQDETAFLATVDPANAEFAQAQVAEFRRMQAFGLVDVSYGVDRYGYGDPTVSGGDPGLRPGTFEHAAIKGIWAHPVGNQVDFTYARRDGQWYVAAETPPSIDNESNWVQSRPWSGDVVVKRVNGLLVVVDAAEAGALDAMAAEADEAMTYVRDTWKVKEDNAILLDASSTGSRTMVNHLADGDTDGTAAGAVTKPVYATQRADLPRTREAGFVVKFNPDYVDTLQDDKAGLKGTLRHELTHYVLRDALEDPLWLVEGMAQYTGSRRFAGALPPYEADYLAQSKAETDPHALVSSALFRTKPDGGYLQGFLAVRFLVQRYGVRKVVDFARSYGRVDADSGDSKTGRLLRKAFDLTPREVAEAAYAGYDELAAVAN